MRLLIALLLAGMVGTGWATEEITVSDSPHRIMFTVPDAKGDDWPTVTVGNQVWVMIPK